MTDLITVMKTLADPTRVKILRFLSEEPLCVCELVSVIGHSQSAISQHLAKLRTAGLVTERREGQWVYYQAVPNLRQGVESLLASCFSSPLPDVALIESELPNYLGLVRAEDRAGFCAKPNSQVGQVGQVGQASPAGAANAATSAAGA